MSRAGSGMCELANQNRVFFFFGRTQELKQRQIRNTVWLYEETDVCFLSKASKHILLGTLNKIINLIMSSSSVVQSLIVGSFQLLLK